MLNYKYFYTSKKCITIKILQNKILDLKTICCDRFYTLFAHMNFKSEFKIKPKLNRK